MKVIFYLSNTVLYESIIPAIKYKPNARVIFSGAKIGEKSQYRGKICFLGGNNCSPPIFKQQK